MEKNTFFVIEQKEIATGKCVSTAQKVANCYNLLHYFKPYNGYEIISINACDTWKQAQEIADYWNEGAKNRGVYALA